MYSHFKQAADTVETLNGHSCDSQTNLEAMIRSMKQADEARHPIAHVTNMMLELSFQTNMLALNAALRALAPESSRAVSQNA